MPRLKKTTEQSATESEENALIQARMDALGRAQAIIEFSPDGTILSANENFCAAMGYTAAEIEGKHHRMFVGPKVARGADYKTFWAQLREGQQENGVFKRLAQGGREVWLQASYSPVFDDSGEVVRVIKFATDITAQKLADADASGKLAAVSKAQAVIEFNLDGTIITANDNFLSVVGYTLDEVKGKHHRMFVEPEFARSTEYADFWKGLNAGKFDAGVYKRIGNGGAEVWIQASYNPIMDLSGKPFKVVKFATDITAQRLKDADVAGQLTAVGESQAVIEFNLDGTIITANDNFLGVVGYTLAELEGKHHRMFVDSADSQSQEYQAFWEGLNAGKFDAGVYKRITKSGAEIWIQASYNPILDLNGKPFKVVKFATDISAQKLADANASGQLDAVSKAQAVIEFNLDGTIIEANENFLSVVGYTLEEIKGKHHRMFVDPRFARSTEYADFWKGLNAGEFDAGVYKRLAKGGEDVWIQASYNPIMDMSGKPFKVVKFATDITAQRIKDADVAGQLTAVGESQAVIEFNLDGTIITANDNFLGVVGYTLAEIKGKHHRMFVDSAYGRSREYREFWEGLNAGKFNAGVYKRITKSGQDAWIQASYNPILDLNDEPFKVVKFATDITAQRLKDADASGQLAAVSKAQAVIEFNLDGTIITANDNFLDVVGYTLAEIRGKHHRLFVESTYSRGAEYADFWKGLNEGQFDAGVYKRITKSGEEVWIQASYNPIMDLSGKPFKVVKFATDITAQQLKDADVAGQLAAVGKSQAVIEFNLDGTIITANDNFLGVVGYTLAEIQGRHHRMFVESAYSASGEYREFWRRLNAGEFNAGTYKRIGKGGKEAWIQASYNPIFDHNGMPFKVVKFATDVTARVVSDERFRADMSVLQEHMARVAQGDLTAKISEPFDGEHAVLRDALNETLDALNETLLQVSQVAGNVASGSEQVSESSGNLSQGATDQAASLRQITTTITLLTEQTKQNAEHARVASELSTDARGVAVDGDGMMKNMVTAMGGIDESSQSIRKIIKVIDEIAFQTNLLALNAAVEAARAGVHGKGFAVVAEEVRSLAARSAKAAKETTEMIEDSLKKVAVGTGLANKTADALTKIVDGVGKVTDLVAEIAAASNEQARGISDVNDGVSQIDNVTQANTAAAEESAAASQVLSQQASELNRRLERFQLAQLNAPTGMPANLPPELMAALHQMLEDRGFAAGAANGLAGITAAAAGSDFGFE